METAVERHFGCSRLARRHIARRVLPVAAFCLGIMSVAAEDHFVPPQVPALLNYPLIQSAAEFTNWVELSYGHFWVGDSEEYFQRRHQLRAASFGGIESFHWENSLGTDGLLEIDGRAIFDNHDYLLSLSSSKENLGFVRAGYREYRTWYDRSGGYSPLGEAWFEPWDREGAVDRGELWFEAGLRLENVPQLTFRFAHEFRDGIKDSTAWGDTRVNQGAPPPVMLRNVVPAMWDINEQRNVFQLDARHTIAKTDFGIGLRYENMQQENSRLMLRRPGEPQERFLTHADDAGYDMFNAHGFTETWVSQKVLLTTGAAYTRLESDFSGDRIYGAGFEAVYDPLFARRQQFDEGFLDLVGSGVRDQYLVSLNLLALPWENFSLLPSVRFEAMDEDARSHFEETNVGPAPGLTPLSEELEARQATDYISVSESLEARYTGLTNWLLYVRGEWTQDSGNQTEREFEVETAENIPIQDKDDKRLTQKYVAGLTWYPLRRVSLGAQYYHKIRNVDYDIHFGASNSYSGFIRDQDFTIDDVNFRVTLRPLSSLTLVTRYDLQYSTIDTTSVGLGGVGAGRMISHIVGQSVSWSPWRRIFLQGSGNYVYDRTDSPANDIVGLEGLVQESHNDYWTANAVVGIALSDTTDLQFQYFYYRSDNYRNNSTVSQPYDAGAEEHGATATLAHQFTRALRGTLRYGYFDNRDVTYGRHKDFQAHLLYTSLQYRF